VRIPINRDVPTRRCQTRGQYGFPAAKNKWPWAATVLSGKAVRAADSRGSGAAVPLVDVPPFETGPLRRWDRRGPELGPARRYLAVERHQPRRLVQGRGRGMLVGAHGSMVLPRRLAFPAAMIIVLTLTWPPGATANVSGGCRPWKLFAVPGVTDASLGGVSGTSSTDVWAVGGGSSSSDSVIVHWDGTAWADVPHPIQISFLTGVAAITPDDAWAVGYNRPVAMHWNGTGWRRVLIPLPGSDQFLNDVSATSSTDVWAVGYYVGEGIHPLVERWDGSRWRRVSAPDARPGTNALYGVTAISPDDAWAVGHYDTTGGADFQPFILHWDGDEWSVVDAELPPSGSSNHLFGVSAATPTDVWAVGYWGHPEPHQPLIEHWDGTSWRIQQAAPGPGEVNILSAVSAASSTEVWAVGESSNPPAAGYRPFTQHWDGTAWSYQKAPSPGLNANLHAVSAISSEDVWAVGAVTHEVEPVRPLTQRSRGAC
jgi:hypothetical protein